MKKLNLMDRKARAVLMVAGALTMATVLSACNTVEGFGRDTERAGEKLQNQAK